TSTTSSTFPARTQRRCDTGRLTGSCLTPPAYELPALPPSATHCLSEGLPLLRYYLGARYGPSDGRLGAPGGGTRCSCSRGISSPRTARCHHPGRPHSSAALRSRIGLLPGRWAGYPVAWQGMGVWLMVLCTVA